MPDEVARDAKVTADRLADPVAIQRPGERVGDRVGDRAVVLVARVQRCDEVVATLEDRPRQELDPFGDDRPEIGVDHDQGLHLEGRGDLEDRPQRGPLAADPGDLGVREADALQLVGRPHEEDLLHVVRRLGLDHDATRAVG